MLQRLVTPPIPPTFKDDQRRTQSGIGTRLLTAVENIKLLEMVTQTRQKSISSGREQTPLRALNYSAMLNSGQISVC